jgi:hypothetical protein
VQGLNKHPITDPPVCHYCKKGPTADASLYPIATVGTYYMHVPPCEANPDGKKAAWRRGAPGFGIYPNK